MAYPSDVANVSLSQYDFTRNTGADKYVTVVATFYSGCTPGREDYPTFTKYVSQLRSLVRGTGTGLTHHATHPIHPPP